MVHYKYTCLQVPRSHDQWLLHSTSLTTSNLYSSIRTLFEWVWSKTFWTLLGDNVAKCALAHETWLGSPYCFSSWEGGGLGTRLGEGPGDHVMWIQSQTQPFSWSVYPGTGLQSVAYLKRARTSWNLAKVSRQCCLGNSLPFLLLPSQPACHPYPPTSPCSTLNQQRSAGGLAEVSVTEPIPRNPGGTEHVQTVCTRLFSLCPRTRVWERGYMSPLPIHLPLWVSHLVCSGRTRKQTQEDYFLCSVCNMAEWKAYFRAESKLNEGECLCTHWYFLLYGFF